MDAVVLANYFHQHAPFAIRALEAGKHVLSETACNSTLAEGVALCRAVERSRKIYMLAENYPYTVFNQELQRLYQSGEIGEATYAEGEYNHPIAPPDRLRIAPGLNHWRNWIPSTYYCTHALAPLVFISGLMPTRVNALSIAIPIPDDTSVRRGDAGSVILCRMENGAVFRLFGLVLPGHSNWYRMHGTKGAMEITRGPGYFGPEQVRVWHEPWNRPEGALLDRTYTPEWPSHADLAELAGHGGGDFWVNLRFAEAIFEQEAPFLDVYRGVAMSSVGILAWKSALEDGCPYDVPNFRDESDRKKVENDHWSPFPESDQLVKPPASILSHQEPSDEDIEAAKRIWSEIWQ